MMRRILSAFYAKGILVEYGQNGYWIGVRGMQREAGARAPEEPSNRAYRATLTVGVPHPEDPSLPWWRQ